jgi:hypothetical protein
MLNPDRRRCYPRDEIHRHYLRQPEALEEGCCASGYVETHDDEKQSLQVLKKTEGLSALQSFSQAVQEMGYTVKWSVPP